MISTIYSNLPINLIVAFLLLLQCISVSGTLQFDLRPCDNDFCDDVVTKCRSNGRCSCDIEQVFCRKDCVDCLEEKFGKCCGCIDGLCPVVRGEAHSSHVGDIPLDSRYEQLFETLTETDDIHGRWTVAYGLSSKLIDHPELGQLRMSLNGSDKRLVVDRSDDKPTATNEQDVDQDLSGDGVSEGGTISNQATICVVAFINKELGMSQCKRYCRSMGASSFRWFHEGCCECVGKSCIHYGLADPKCSIDYDYKMEEF